MEWIPCFFPHVSSTLDFADPNSGGRLGRLAKIGQRLIDALLKRVSSKTWGAKARFAQRSVFFV